MSDTPRTDEVMRESSADAGSAWLEMRDHARKLERELREAQATLCECADYYHGLWGDEAGTSWREQPNERAARWRKAAGINPANAHLQGCAEAHTLQGVVRPSESGGVK